MKNIIHSMLTQLFCSNVISLLQQQKDESKTNEMIIRRGTELCREDKLTSLNRTLCYHLHVGTT